MAEGQAGRDGEAESRCYSCHHQGRRRVVGVFTHGDEGGKGGQTLVVGAGIHRQPFERQDLRLGQEEHGRVIAQVGQQLVVESPGVVQPGGERHHWPLLQLPDGSQVKGLMVGVQSERRPGVGGGQVPQVPLQPRL